MNDHIGHALVVERDARYGVVTRCQKCRILVAVSPYDLPKSMRVRKTWCVIQYNDFPRMLAAGEDISDIGIARGLYWKDVLSGCGTPNVDAGDAFNREKGRKESLTNALRNLPSAVWPWQTSTFVAELSFAAFRNAAWEALWSRRSWRVNIIPGPVYMSESERQFALDEMNKIYTRMADPIPVPTPPPATPTDEGDCPF